RADVRPAHGRARGRLGIRGAELRPLPREHVPGPGIGPRSPEIDSVEEAEVRGAWAAGSARAALDGTPRALAGHGQHRPGEVDDARDDARLTHQIRQHSTRRT